MKDVYTVLEELNHHIPNDLYQRFTALEAPWQVQAVAKSIFQTLASRLQMITPESVEIVEDDHKSDFVDPNTELQQSLGFF